MDSKYSTKNHINIQRQIWTYLEYLYSHPVFEPLMAYNLLTVLDSPVSYTSLQVQTQFHATQWPCFIQMVVCKPLYCCQLWCSYYLPKFALRIIQNTSIELPLAFGLKCCMKLSGVMFWHRTYWCLFFYNGVDFHCLFCSFFFRPPEMAFKWYHWGKMTSKLTC